MAEKKATAKAGPAKKKAAPSTDKLDGAATVRATYTAMPEPDRTLGQRIHEIVMATAPDLTPRLWYGMPAYANADGKVVCFFQGAAKFKTRFSTFGFQDAANLDDGGLWPTSFGLKELTAADEARIAALVTRAVS